MRHLRRQRDFLAWLMSVAVSCNIILAMLCCTPLGMAHGSGPGAGGDFASVLCSTGGVQAATPDGQLPASHKPLHSQCTLCSTAAGGWLTLLPSPFDAQEFAVNAGEAIAFQAVAIVAASHFAFAEPSSRGPPRA